MFAPTNFIFADIGLPMGAVYLPPAWLALVPIILIESGYGTWRYKFPFRQAVSAQITANCISTLIGIPITWLVIVLFEMTAFEWSSHLLPERVVSILSPLAGAAWLAPERTLWVTGIAIAVLTLMFYLMSVVTEGFVVRRHRLSRWFETVKSIDGYFLNQAGGSRLAAVDSDENSERRFSGANEKRILALRFRVMAEPFETYNTRVEKFLTKP
jgi:hypothetical protein